MSDRELIEIRSKISKLQEQARSIKKTSDDLKYDGQISFPIILEYTSKANLKRYNHHLKYDYTPYTTLGLYLGEYCPTPYREMVPPELTCRHTIVLNLGNVPKPEYDQYRIKLIIEPVIRKVKPSEDENK